MTDKEKLDKLVAETKGLIADYNIKTEKYRGMNEQAHQYYGGKRDALSEILKSIVSMQEEPVSEKLEKVSYQGEEYIRCYHDELDEFANKYPKTVPLPEKRYAKYSDVDMVIAVKAGANWQKEQFEKDYTNLCNGIATAKGLAVAMAYDKGMADAREQMMAKAVDVTIAITYQNSDGGFTQLVDSKEALPFGDNIKVLVIKED